MQTGLSLQQLATQVADQRQRARDYRVSTSAIEMDADMNIRARNGVDLTIRPNDLFHQQLAEKNGIPAKYYRKMQAEQPELLRQNVNTWLRSAGNEKRLLRTFAPTTEAIRDAGKPFVDLPLDGRAFLSSSYKPLDNVDMLEALMPPLLNSGLKVASAQITETKTYLQLVTDRIQATVKMLKPGTHERIDDPIQLGLVVSNSEVGCGALSIQVLVYRLVCTNGLIVGSDLPSFRRAHIGKEFDIDESVLTDDTRRLRDAAIWSQARDIVTAAVSQTTLDSIAERLNGIAKVRLEDPAQAVELVSKRFDLLETEKNSVLKNLIEGGDVSQWGLTNAVTALANTTANYDRVIELEQIGGKVADLPAGLFAGKN